MRGSGGGCAEAGGAGAGGAAALHRGRAAGAQLRLRGVQPHLAEAGRRRGRAWRPVILPPRKGVELGVGAAAPCLGGACSAPLPEEQGREQGPSSSQLLGGGLSVGHTGKFLSFGHGARAPLVSVGGVAGFPPRPLSLVFRPAAAPRHAPELLLWGGGLGTCDVGPWRPRASESVRRARVFAGRICARLRQKCCRRLLAAAAGGAGAGARRGALSASPRDGAAADGALGLLLLKAKPYRRTFLWLIAARGRPAGPSSPNSCV
jgi:hypothetical protein